MFRPTARTIVHHLKPRANVPLLTRAYASRKPPAADEGSGEFNGPLYNNVQPLTSTGTDSPTHTTRKPHALDFQTSASKYGMQEREAAEKSDAKRREQSGGGDTKVKWDDQFPKKPDGPIIGMQDERGGIDQDK